MEKLKMISLFVLIFSFFVNTSFGASCCVGNTSLPNLMTIPAKWQFSSQATYSKVIGDASTNGDYVFRDSSNKDTSQILRLDVAFQRNEWQMGIGGQFIQNTRHSNSEEESNRGIGDIFIYGAREFNIEYERFNPLFNFRIPNAPSNYNSKEKLQTDARGSGVPEVSTGILWIHTGKTWDSQIAPTLFYRFSKTFNENEKIKVGSQWGGALMLGMGFVPWRSKYRISTSLTPRYESSKKMTSNETNTKSDRVLSVDSLVGLTYMINAHQNLGLNYLDQTLVGPARNTLLSRSLSLVFQERW